MLKKAFINLKLLLIILLSYFLLSWADNSPLLFPSFTPYFDYSIGEEILGNIIKAASGFLGITVTVLIISMQLLRSKFDDYAMVVLFKNNKLRTAITLFLLSVILPLISLILLPHGANPQLFIFDYNRIYFSLVLFICVFFYFFSNLPNVIKSTNSIEIIDNLVNKVRKENVLAFIKSHKEDSLIYVKKKEGNSIIDLHVC